MVLNKSSWLGQLKLAQSPTSRRTSPGASSRASLSGIRFRLAAGAQILTDETFSKALAAPMAVVDFWSPDCGYCMTYKPIFEEVASEYGGRILMATANVNDAMQSAGSYGIEGIPATIFLANGKEVGRFEGETSKTDLVNEIARLFGGSGATSVVPSKPFPTTLAIGGALAAAGLIAYLALK